MATIQNTAQFVETVAQAPHTMAITLGAGTNRKLAVATVVDGGALSVNAVTFDGTSIFANLATSLTHPADSSVKIQMFYYDIPDGKGAGSYDIIATTSVSTAAITLYGWIVEDAATGAPEDADSVSAASPATSIAVSLTCSDGAVFLAAGIHAAVTPTYSWTGDVTERYENNETQYTSSVADGVQSGAGTKTATATTNANNQLLAGMSFAAAVTGPTISVQPTAQTKVLTNANTATFSVTASGTGSLSYDWELEDGVASGVYANVANGSGATWTGQAAASLVGTFTAKTLSGRRVRCNITDDNGTTTTDAVALTLFNGPQVTAFGPTNASGVSTATLTCDYVTGVGEAIEVAVVLPDGRVTVTTTTTA